MGRSVSVQVLTAIRANQSERPMAVFPVACNENHFLFIPPNVGGARSARAVTAERVNILRRREGQTQHSTPGDSQCWQTEKSNQIKQSGINYTKDFFVYLSFLPFLLIYLYLVDII